MYALVLSFFCFTIQDAEIVAKLCRFKVPNGHDITKQAIIDVNSIVSGRNYDILTSIIAKLLTSQPFDDMSHYAK